MASFAAASYRFIQDFLVSMVDVVLTLISAAETKLKNFSHILQRLNVSVRRLHISFKLMNV